MNENHWQIISLVIFLAGFTVMLFVFVILRKKLNKNRRTTIIQPDSMTHEVSIALNRKLFCGARQSIGNRETQQDSVRIPLDDIPVFEIRKTGCFCVLCDGMGGRNGGELASQTCSHSMFNDFYSLRSTSDLTDFFKQSIEKVNYLVSEIVDDSGIKLNSGTTMVCALVRNNQLYWASAGDSRIYLWQNGYLTQLTQDHNYYQMLLEQAAEENISVEHAISDRKKDALTSYIGMNVEDVPADISTTGIELSNEDIIMLCSDGLYRALDDDEISLLIREHHDQPALIPDILLYAALSKQWMSHDNISVITISYMR